MDDIIEFIVEVIFDILLEGSMEFFSDRKMPKWLRIVVLFVLLVVFCGIVGIFLYIAYEASQENDMVAAGVSFAIAIAVAVFFVVGFICKYRERNKRKKDENKY